MVLIPPDIGLRLRLQNDLLPQPITPLQEIPADLPDLKAGQTFSARIQEVLPESTYRALVAGKSITLSLPESVKSGDILELVVVDRTPKTIIAQLAPQSGAAAEAAADYPHTTLSRAAQLIGTLLPAEGEAPSAAPLNRGQPLLAQPPQTGRELAPVLGKAVAESGLFYESHQAQWVAGKLPLASLLQEPQGLRSSPQARIAAQAEKLLLAGGPQHASGGPTAAAASTAAQSEIQALLGQAASPAGNIPGTPGQAAGLPATGVPASPLPQGAPGPDSPELNPSLAKSGAAPAKAEAAAWIREMALVQAGSQPPTPTQLAASLREAAEAQRQQANSQVSPAVTAASIPDELRPLVQQQLDAAGTQRLIWHGEVWPGQDMQWEIEWEDHGGGNSERDDAEAWTTTLRLETPRLGELVAALRLRPGGVKVALMTPSGASAADLRAGAPLLEKALAEAGVPMLGFAVKQARDADPEDTGGTGG